MRVLLFARAKDIVGADRLEIALPAGATVAALRRALAQAHPALASLLEKSALAVNGEFAQEETQVPADAEVALLPPVSGG
jgi:molybdopterin converting factor subunit 1